MRGLYSMMEYVLYGGRCPYLGRTTNATGPEPGLIGHIIDRFHNRLYLLQSNYIVQYNQLSVSYRPGRSAHLLVSLVGVPHPSRQSHRSRQFHPNHQIQLGRAISSTNHV